MALSLVSVFSGCGVGSYSSFESYYTLRRSSLLSTQFQVSLMFESEPRWSTSRWPTASSAASSMRRSTATPGPLGSVGPRSEGPRSEGRRFIGCARLFVHPKQKPLCRQLRPEDWTLCTRSCTVHRQSCDFSALRMPALSALSIVLKRKPPCDTQE